MHFIRFKNSKNWGSQKEEIAKLIVDSFKDLSMETVLEHMDETYCEAYIINDEDGCVIGVALMNAGLSYLRFLCVKDSKMHNEIGRTLAKSVPKGTRLTCEPSLVGFYFLCGYRVKRVFEDGYFALEKAVN